MKNSVISSICMDCRRPSPPEARWGGLRATGPVWLVALVALGAAACSGGSKGSTLFRGADGGPQDAPDGTAQNPPADGDGGASNVDAAMTGTVAGQSLSIQDGIAIVEDGFERDGRNAAMLFIGLSSAHSLCDAVGQDVRRPNTTSLAFQLFRTNRTDPPAPPEPGVFTVDTGRSRMQNGDYVEVEAYWSRIGPDCRPAAGSDEADDGRLTIIEIDEHHVKGSFDLDFSGDLVSGSFDLPRCQASYTGYAGANCQP